MSATKKTQGSGKDAPVANEPEATSTKVEVSGKRSDNDMTVLSAHIDQPENEGNEENEEEEEEEEDGDVALLDELDLPESVLKRVKGLRKLQDDYAVIEKEYKEQRLALEKSFLTRKEVLYQQRHLVVTGASDISEEGTLSEANKDENPEEKGVPSFWLTALSAHPVIGQLITEEDVPALETLTNITVQYSDNFEPDLLDDKSPALMKIDGTTIEWKTGKNLGVKEITKKQKAKGGRNKGQVRTVTRTVPKPSFFHYFDDPTEAEEEEEEPEEEEEGQIGRIKFNLDEDYDIGHTIRTAIIPEAILWFTGEAEVDDGLYGDEDDEDEEGDGADDEEGEDEGEGEEDDDAKAEKKNKNKGGAANSGEKPPECKQN